MKERPNFVDVPLEDRNQQSQSPGDLNILRKVGVAATVAIITTVATVALFATTAVVPKQKTLNHDSPQLDFALPSAENSNLHDLHKVTTRAQSPALSSPLGVLTHPKNDVDERIRELKDKYRLRNVPDPNYEEVAEQVKKELEHDTRVPLPSITRSEKQRVPSNPPQTPDPDYVEEKITLEKYEEHDKHPRDVRLPTTTQDEHPKLLSTDKERQEIKEGESDSIENTETHKKPVKESNKLPTTTISDSTQICTTTACYEAASRISESLDRSVDPCEDFYQFACGGWIDKHPIPENGWGGTYIDAVKRTNSRLLEILETPAYPDAPDPLKKLRTHFNSCMDTDTLDALGLEPLDILLSAQGGWPMVMEDWNPKNFSLSTALNNLRSLNVYPLIHVAVSTDVFNTSRYLIIVDAGEVPIGVITMASVSNETIAPYRTFMTTAAKMLRDSMGSTTTDQHIDDQVANVIDFEIKFSQIVMKAVNETTNHAWQTNVTELQEDMDAGTPDQFDWLSFLKEMFADTDITITKDEPLLSFKGPFFKDFSNLLANTNPRTIANAIGWWWVHSLKQETTYAMRNASQDYFQDFYGVSTPTPRSKLCLAMANANLAFALSREYVDHFVPKAVKPEAEELVKYLREGFSSLLKNNTWMLEDDLEVAQEKLAAIDPFVAYPDWIMDDEQLTQGYAGMELVDGKHIKNLVHIGEWFNLNMLAALREVPQHMFLINPTIVNSVYSPTQNSIFILSGMIQPPFYGHDSLAALNYGALGMIIGHEMTHGFDSIGRMFDKFGNLRQWWSNETIEAFNERAMCFVKQYYKYIPPELSEIGLNIPVNGIQTLAENIADNGGIREAFKAYQAYVKFHGEEPRLPGLEEFSSEEIFYLGFANPWCEHKSPEMVLQLLVLDAHSPGRFRVLGPLSNDEEFSKVWKCPPGSPMNNGKDRCLLW